MSSLTPPPPIPRRRLIYAPGFPPRLPPNELTYYPDHQVFSQRPNASTTTSVPVSAQSGAGPEAESNAMSCPSYDMPRSPGGNSQQYQQRFTPTRATTTYSTTLCFYDHMHRMAMVLPVPVLRPGPSTTAAGPSPSPAPSLTASHSLMLAAGSSPISTPAQQNTHVGPGNTLQVEDNRPQITFQLYLHSLSPAFNNERGLHDVEEWCRKLQFSKAIYHLRDQLGGARGPPGAAATFRIEVYEALPDYNVWTTLPLRILLTTYP